MTAMTPTILEPRSGCPRISLRKTFAPNSRQNVKTWENQQVSSSQRAAACWHLMQSSTDITVALYVKYCVGQKLVWRLFLRSMKIQNSKVSLEMLVGLAPLYGEPSPRCSLPGHPEVLMWTGRSIAICTSSSQGHTSSQPRDAGTHMPEPFSIHRSTLVPSANTY